MFTFTYPATFERDEASRWLVGFRDFPTAHTDGADEAEAMAEAADCLGGVIAFAMADKIDVPKPGRPRSGERLVQVPGWIVPKLALYWAVVDTGIGGAELARRLNVRNTVVRRMLDPNQSTRIDKIEAALATLGKRLVTA